MSKDADMIIWNDNDIKSNVAGQFNPLFRNFKQSDVMNINCEIDNVQKGAPLPFDRSWNFNFQQGSQALSNGVTNFQRIFPNGLAFFGMKKVMFLDNSNDQNYYFTAPTPTTQFGAAL